MSDPVIWWLSVRVLWGFLHTIPLGLTVSYFSNFPPYPSRLRSEPSLCPTRQYLIAVVLTPPVMVVKKVTSSSWMIIINVWVFFSNSIRVQEMLPLVKHLANILHLRTHTTLTAIAQFKHDPSKSLSLLFSIKLCSFYPLLTYIWTNSAEVPPSCMLAEAISSLTRIWSP